MKNSALHRPRLVGAQFYWPGTLTLLPVVLLAVIGFWAVIREIRVAEQETLQKCQQSADLLARRLHLDLEAELREYIVLANEHRAHFRSASWAGDSITWAPSPRNPTLDARIADWERRHPNLQLRALAVDSFGLSTNGYLLTHVEWQLSVVPPEWVGRLSASSVSLWREAEDLEANGELAAARAAWARWRRDLSDPEARINGEFALARLADDSRVAMNRIRIPSPSPSAPSGMPLVAAVLAEQLRTRGKESVDEGVIRLLRRAVTECPSLLTPRLLAAVEGKVSSDDTLNRDRITLLKQRSVADEETRHRARQLRDAGVVSESSRSHSFWFREKSPPPPSPQVERQNSLRNRGGSYFCLIQPALFTNSSPASRATSDFPIPMQQVTLVRESVMFALVAKVWQQNRDAVPAFARAAVQLAGEQIVGKPISGSAGVTGRATERLRISVGEAPLLVTVSDGSGGSWRAGFRWRAMWLGLFVVAATGAAMAGLLATRRAYRKQLALNQQKNNFVSAVSHELRAPIATVQLMVENLASGMVSDKETQRAYYRNCLHECRRLSGLVGNVLDLARIEQGRMTYEFEPLDLAALVKGTVQVMTPLAQEKDVTLSDVSSASEPVEIVADSRSLQQAIVNLIDNAIKYSPGGTVEVKWEAAGTTRRISVADQGPGVPPAERERIFEWFYRVGSELCRETFGVGIGLYMVKQIVLDHGGRVWVEDCSTGVGSRFIMEFPESGPPGSN